VNLTLGSLLPSAGRSGPGEVTLYDLLVNLLASVVAGVAVWLGQQLFRRRRRVRRQAFFGVQAAPTCLLVAPRHSSSSRPNSVHRQDVAALVELASVVKGLGGEVELVAAEEIPPALGRVPEFCVGGPSANARTAVHLRTLVPGVEVSSDTTSGPPELTVGGQAFPYLHREQEHVVLVKVRPAGTRKPIFLVIGQRAASNLAAARYLAGHHDALRRKYSVNGRFCVILRVTQSSDYGTDLVELAHDATPEAFTPRSG
jgi:hypothetical protein